MIRDWFWPVYSATSAVLRGVALNAGSDEFQDAGAAARTWSPEPSRQYAGYASDSQIDSAAGLRLVDGGAAGEATLDGAFDSAAENQELREFLASDLDPVPADPVFRERLREELWEMVANGRVARPKDS